MSSHRARRGSPRLASRSAGFSLIEVLVSVLVLGIGLLALAMLQVTNLRLVQSSSSRTAAVMIANDIIEKMRRNRSFAAGYVGVHAALPAGYEEYCVTRGPSWESTLCAMKRHLGDNASADIKLDRNSGIVSVYIKWGDAKRWRADAAATEFLLESRL